MADRGYNNFYTPNEYDSYQQHPFENYGQTPYYYHPEPYRTPTLEENLMKFEQWTMESVAYTKARKEDGTFNRLENNMNKLMEMQQLMQQEDQQMQQMQEQRQYQEKNYAALK
ncbi:hypothetical protein L195_g059274, partial [Trifolium pratense]